jgi:threonine dehydrogenase-like Zn-dependent dehydrogenase
MKVLQITGKEQFEFITMPVPEPEYREVRIKRLGIVTCNAYDLNIYQGKPYPNINGTLTFPYPPGGPGHEWVGVVDKLGPGVTQFSIGDWVCLPGGRGEGRGMYPMGYAPYSVCHETCLIKVPAGMDIAKLAPFEMATCMAANIIDLKAMKAIEGKRVAVMGLGPAGLIGAQMLKAEGAAEVIGMDIDKGRREYAVSSGLVNRSIGPPGDDGKNLPLRPSTPIDTGIDCAGRPAAIEYLIDHTKDIVSFFAVQLGPFEFKGGTMERHEGLNLRRHPGRNFECGEYTLEVIANSKIDLSLVISHKMRLEDYDKAMKLIKSHQALKVLFTFDERDW